MLMNINAGWIGAGNTDQQFVLKMNYAGFPDLLQKFCNRFWLIGFFLLRWCRLGPSADSNLGSSEFVKSSTEQANWYCEHLKLWRITASLLNKLL